MTTPKNSRVDAIDIDDVDLRLLSSHDDVRGGFLELMRESTYGESFRQSNLSRSVAGVLRGLHFHQRQADLWFVLEGQIQVALADLRSPGRLRTSSLLMSEEHPHALFIPPGVAHGFLALTDCKLLYWVTEEFDGSDEYGIKWDDPLVAIQWQHFDPLLSERDRSNPPLDWGRIPEFGR